MGKIMGKIDQMKEKAREQAGKDRLTEIMEGLARTNRRLGETLTILKTLPASQSQVSSLRQVILGSVITGGLLLMVIVGWLEIRADSLKMKAANWDRVAERYQQMTPETQQWVRQNLFQ